jgi:O-antigen ligase
MKRLRLHFSVFTIGFILLVDLIGELYRFHGYLLLDLLLPLVCAAWLVKNLLERRPIHWPRTLPFAAFFCLFGLSSLLIHAGDMGAGNLLGAAFYGVRWASAYFLCVIVQSQSDWERGWTEKLLFGFSLLLCLAGFAQLDIMPDFTAMEALGWDPHQNRLLSTWFDPNFVGGFLAFVLPMIIGTALDRPKERVWLVPLAAVVTLALALTLSRSAYLAMLAGLFVFGLLRSVKLLAAGGILLVLMTAVLPPVQSRFFTLVDNIESVFVDNYTLPDASARLRFASWSEAWQLFQEDPILGQGYNRYKYAALELGTLKDLNIHSASGSDSSLLNILATTGILGFLPFFTVYIFLAQQAWRQRKDGYSAGFFAALCGLFIHSIFVNSLLFPLFMAPFWISAGLLRRE